MLIPRNMNKTLLDLAEHYPVVSVTGPRQSGKTTLVREAFSTFEYVSMENPDTRASFEDDPNTFLKRYNRHVIFDEAQRTPELFSYLQGIVDETRELGRFVITGSQNFLLMRGIDQSLAGRVALLTLLPLSYDELLHSSESPRRLEDWLYQGGYPRIYDAEIEPAVFFSNYLQTYLERDVRQELGVRKLHDFTTFLQLCALRTGQQLNLSELARDAGVSFNTAKDWLSVLEASGIVYLLRPFFSNRGKTLVKSPKLYFLDTGLAANLMGVRSSDELTLGEYRGPLFEAAVISEVLKAGYELGVQPALSYWRDANKREVDLVVQRGLRPVQAIEIKSSATYNPRFFDVLKRVAQNELGLDASARAVVYGGDEELHTGRGDLVPLSQVHDKAREWLGR